MKKIGIVTNVQRDIQLKTTKKLVEFLQSENCVVYMERSLKESMSEYDDICFEENIYCDVDFVIVLGGDGTMLQTAKYSSQWNIPIIGINLGNMGYLTDVEKNDGVNAIRKVLSGHYKKEKRMMIDVSIQEAGGEIKLIGRALNDVYVLRSPASKLVEVKIYVNGEYIDNYRCDGLIVSTPTGSTAYNLSAGGPILIPDSEMIAITPICPHTLYARPFVISSNDEIVIHASCSYDNKNVVCIDGYDERTIDNQTIVKINRSDHNTTVLKTNELGFYDILRLKMVGEVRK